jgi:hypothetical protein
LFRETKKLRCPHCYGSVIDWCDTKQYSEKSKSLLDQFPKTFQPLPSFNNLLQKSNQVSQVRLRIARNLNGFSFKIQSKDIPNFYAKVNAILKNFLTIEEKQVEYHTESFSLKLFDEDHLRFYCYPKNIYEVKRFYKIISFLDQKAMFAFKERFGYLSECPSNVSRGNKLSIFISLNSEINWKLINKDWMIFPETSIHLQKNPVVLCFIKNFRLYEARKFLDICLHHL